MFKDTFASFALKRAKGLNSLINLVGLSRGWLSNKAPVTADLEYKGDRVRVSLRPKTSDFAAFHEIFFMEYYRLPKSFQPKTIVDFGGNIGLASLYFHLAYPQARIHTFEPIPENLEMIRKNLTENQPTGSSIYPFGVSNSDRLIELSIDNTGDYGCAYETSKPHGATSFKVPVRRATEALREAGISQIDLLKIDIEGAEREVLPEMENLLPSIEIIIGELHGDAKEMLFLLNLLAKTHHVDFYKQLDVPLITFRASLKNWNSY